MGVQQLHTQQALSDTSGHACDRWAVSVEKTPESLFYWRGPFHCRQQEVEMARKYIGIGVALDHDTLAMVDRLAEEQERNRSQTIRFLLRQVTQAEPDVGSLGAGGQQRRLEPTPEPTR
jgi:hypothetical protein